MTSAVASTRTSRTERRVTAPSLPQRHSEIERPRAFGRVVGANDRINVGLIGAVGRGRSLLRWVMETGGQIPHTPAPGARSETLAPPDPRLAAEVVAVCDVYVRRRRFAEAFAKCEGVADYRQLLDRPDVDAVIIATPDHWHARMA